MRSWTWPDKKGLNITFQTGEYDWGLGFSLRLVRFSLTFWLVFGVITIFWANMTTQQAIDLLTKESS
jgi:hypothetical protein